MYGPSFNAPITSGSMAEFRVASSTNSVLILSSSVHRRAATVFNHGSSALYLRYTQNLNTSASLAQFSVKLPSGSYFELPAAYQGQVHGIWDAANGFSFITDFTSRVSRPDRWSATKLSMKL